MLSEEEGMGGEGCEGTLRPWFHTCLDLVVASGASEDNPAAPKVSSDG